MREAATQMPDQNFGKIDKTFCNTAYIHDFAGKNEHRYRKKRKLVDPDVELLRDNRQKDFFVGKNQPKHWRRTKGEYDRHSYPDQAQHDPYKGNRYHLTSPSHGQNSHDLKLVHSRPIFGHEPVLLRWLIREQTRSVFQKLLE